MSGQWAVGSGQTQLGAGCLIKPFSAREISSTWPVIPACPLPTAAGEAGALPTAHPVELYAP
jgi:hypothetical protein